VASPKKPPKKQAKGHLIPIHTEIEMGEASTQVQEIGQAQGRFCEQPSFETWWCHLRLSPTTSAACVKDNKKHVKDVTVEIS